MANYNRSITCTIGCAQDLREDIRAGLIYGPYAQKLDDGTLQFLSRRQWATLTGQCVYCGSPMPTRRVAWLRKNEGV
jgi:hypothetical protein